MSFFLLIATQTDNGFGRIYRSIDIARKRLELKQWSLYKNTPYKNLIMPNDNVIIYLAGNGENAQTFFASATIKEISNGRNGLPSDIELSLELPDLSLILESIQIFKKPLSIKKIFDKLDFIPKSTSKWGCVMQRGLKKISEKDYQTIISNAM